MWHQVSWWKQWDLQNLLELWTPLVQDNRWINIILCGVHWAWIHVFWALKFHIRHLKGHHRTGSIDIQAHQLLQWGCVNNIESNFPTECAGHPVFRRTNSISQKPFERVGGSHLHHSLPKYSIGSGFLHKKARIQLNRIYVTIQLLQFICQLLVSCLPYKKVTIEKQVYSHFKFV